jgi:hypothetical protein
MIHPDSRKIEWITQVASENRFPDLILVEKTIRAFSLLESLALSGCPFIFKGGSAVMLHLNSAKRLSIDIDIICPPGTDIEKYVKYNSGEYGFTDVKLINRKTTRNISKTHAKFYYEVSYITNTDTECILLDVLFENNLYKNIIQLPITSRFLKLSDKPVLVSIPSLYDLLGDKLTAFAPNTTGIPYFKEKKECFMEIIKQLFDVASLFDNTDDLSVVNETFRKFAAAELKYRNLDPENTGQVLDDIYGTALCICLRGQIDPENFVRLLEGIRRIRSFIHSVKYNTDIAVTDASKAAYLATLIAKNINEPLHFNPEKIDSLRDANILDPLPPALNKLKKTNPEAFFYWNEIGKMHNR